MRCQPRFRPAIRAMAVPFTRKSRWQQYWRNESGEATIEFVGVVLLLLVPLLYLILVFFQVQAGLYAAETGAAASARILTEHPHTGMEAAQLAIQVAAADQGIPVEGVSFSLSCESESCPDAGSRGVVEVQLKVPLPVVGAIAKGMFPTEVTLNSVHPIQWGAHGA